VTRLATVVVAAMTLALGAGRASPNDAPDESNSNVLQGSWRGIAVEMSGQKPEGVAETLTLCFEGNSLTVLEHGDAGSSGTFRIDATKNPTTIDIVYSKDRNRDERRAWGLYKIEGETLTIITVEGEEADRPKDFACEKGKGYTMVTLRRMPE
jgi:uncharacterized protein (TIGR03067 family)